MTFYEHDKQLLSTAQKKIVKTAIHDLTNLQEKIKSPFLNTPINPEDIANNNYDYALMNNALIQVAIYADIFSSSMKQVSHIGKKIASKPKTAALYERYSLLNSIKTRLNRAERHIVFSNEDESAALSLSLKHDEVFKKLPYDDIKLIYNLSNELRSACDEADYYHASEIPTNPKPSDLFYNNIVSDQYCIVVFYIDSLLHKKAA